MRAGPGVGVPHGARLRVSVRLGSSLWGRGSRVWPWAARCVSGQPAVARIDGLAPGACAPSELDLCALRNSCSRCDLVSPFCVLSVANLWCDLVQNTEPSRTRSSPLTSPCLVPLGLLLVRLPRRLGRAEARGGGGGSVTGWEEKSVFNERL